MHCAAQSLRGSGNWYDYARSRSHARAPLAPRPPRLLGGVYP